MAKRKKEEGGSGGPFAFCFTEQTPLDVFSLSSPALVQQEGGGDGDDGGDGSGRGFQQKTRRQRKGKKKKKSISQTNTDDTDETKQKAKRPKRTESAKSTAPHPAHPFAGVRGGLSVSFSPSLYIRVLSKVLQGTHT